LQNEAGVIHVVAETLEDLTPMLGLLWAQGGGVSSLARADEVRRPQGRDPREPARVMPKGRNFH
jgi:error-prone DNA polymerase